LRGIFLAANLLEYSLASTPREKTSDRTVHSSQFTPNGNEQVTDFSPATVGR